MAYEQRGERDFGGQGGGGGGFEAGGGFGRGRGRREYYLIFSDPDSNTNSLFLTPGVQVLALCSSLQR
jgi:hypothetical protein